MGDIREEMVLREGGDWKIVTGRYRGEGREAMVLKGGNV